MIHILQHSDPEWRRAIDFDGRSLKRMLKRHGGILIVHEHAWLVSALRRALARDDAGTAVVCNAFLTKHCVEAMGTVSGLHFFGRTGTSIFHSSGPCLVGLTWGPDDVERLRDGISACERHAEARDKRDDKEGFHGGLGPLYCYFAGFHLDTFGKATDLDGLWVEVNDWSTNFRSEKEYLNWRKHYDNRIIHQVKVADAAPSIGPHSNIITTGS